MTLEDHLPPLPSEGIERPVFILGCGRSGTTAFGTTLSRHPAVTYLNERRDLWFAAYPESDIWTQRAAARGGKLGLTARDADPEKSRLLRRLFHRETVRTSRPTLVEKLPINSFRAELLDHVFPDARFVHIYRNGLEVARSIDRLCQKGEWFGGNAYKWEQLRRYAEGRPDTAALPELCDTYYAKGLLEWRLSTEAAVRFLRSLAADRFLELSYATFSSRPAATIRSVLEFIGVDADPAVLEYADASIARRTSTLDARPLGDLESTLGGELLPLSMSSGGGGLMAHGEPTQPRRR